MSGDPEQKRILVVESDPECLGALCTILGACGYDVLAFGSSVEALANVSGERLDLALLDLFMPEIDCYHVMDTLKRTPEFESMPLILISESDQDGDVLKAYQAGADYHLTRPLTPENVAYGLRLFL